MESDLNTTAGAKSSSQALKMDVNAYAALFLQVLDNTLLVHVYSHILELLVNLRCWGRMNNILYLTLLACHAREAEIFGLLVIFPISP